jgi:hypothetical protein
MLASMRRNTVVLEFRSPLTACGITAAVMERFQQQHNPESLASNRES